MRLNEVLKNFSFLIENKRQYFEMFQWMIDNELIDPNDVNHFISVARNKLQRRDRIIWFLRHFRFYILELEYDRLSDYLMYDDEEIHNLYDKIEKRYNKYRTSIDLSQYASPHDFEHLANDLEHYLNLPIEEIHEYEFQGNESPEYILSMFQQIENEWKEKFSNVVEVLNEHEVLIDFNDGFKWWIVGLDGRVEQECNAMGHCGTPANSNSWTTLSLREDKPKLGEGYVEPHATVIVDNSSDNILEFKGKGNEKLPRKYWGYGKALFLHDFIEGTNYSDSYASENDLHPLDVMTYEEIQEVKPSLVSDIEYIAFTADYDPDAESLLHEKLKEQNHEVYVEKPFSNMGLVEEKIKNVFKSSNVKDNFFDELLISILDNNKDQKSNEIIKLINNIDIGEEDEQIDFPDDREDIEQIAYSLKIDEEDFGKGIYSEIKSKLFDSSEVLNLFSKINKENFNRMRRKQIENGLNCDIYITNKQLKDYELDSTMFVDFYYEMIKEFKVTTESLNNILERYAIDAMKLIEGTDNINLRKYYVKSIIYSAIITIYIPEIDIDFWDDIITTIPEKYFYGEFDSYEIKRLEKTIFKTINEEL